jgi:hypothetical protein
MRPKHRIATLSAALLISATATAARSAQQAEGLPASILYHEPVAMLTSGASAHDGEGTSAANTMELSFTTLGRDFDLKLEMHDVFAPGATVRWVDDTGVVEEPAAGGSHFRGRLEGDPGSWVRLTLRGNALAGIVATGDEMYFLEPAARFFASAKDHETVAFRLSDVDAEAIQVGCGTSHRTELRRRTKLTRFDLRRMLDDAAGSVAAAAGVKRADIGLVADFEYFNKAAHGTTTAADMAEILNNVDGIYQSELGVTVQAGGTTVFTTSNDPFSASTILGLLQQVGSWKDANDNNSSQPMWGADLVHLFTGRNLDGSVIGIAYLNALCESSAGVGVDEDWTTSLSMMAMLMAHEMGHNFGAPHDNQSGSACASEPGTFIMNPSLSSSLQQKFSPCSKNLIAAEVASAGCLADVMPGTPTPTLPPPTATHTPTPPALAAQFVSQSVPSSMTGGQQYSVSVTMRNTGTTTWTAASLFRLGAVNPYDNVKWGMNRVGLGGSDSVAPGQQKTFTWTVIAPSSGNHNFQWRMLREGVAWFGDMSTNAVVAVSGGGVPNATFVSHSVPTSMVAGQQYSVSVTMRNTGGTTWTPSGFYRLGAVNWYDNVTWGMNRVAMASGESIAPNQTKTFTWTVTAPSSAGTYNFQWRMVQDGVMWFGPMSTNAAVTVTGGGAPNASFVSQSVPTSMVAGQLYSVSLTMQNTGSTTWSWASLHRLGATNPYDNGHWGMNRVSLSSGQNVAPGQQKTFTWTVRAPTTPGQYNFQWRMLQEGVTWFGGMSTNRVVSVQ